MGKKIEFWDVKCIVKQYSIIGKVVFWNDKIGQNDICHYECSYNGKLKSAKHC